MPKKKSTKNKQSDITKTVNQLYSLMKKEKLAEIEWAEEDSFKLQIKRRTGHVVPTAAPSTDIMQPAKKEKKRKKEDTKEYIRSPMNGIFYRSPSPGAEAFVKEGEEVSAGATVCIIEAMKLMNEVQIEKNCQIKKAIAENGSAVKVNDPLFEVKNY
ncbi:MAG: acetyl-CoA carboxylase biotin carboxyl carrier protein [Elusimicrobiota bacterium]